MLPDFALRFRPYWRREVEALPFNGLTVASLFAGVGGSCYGFRMAGFQPLYACDFIEHAAKNYRPNHPGAFVDFRDVRKVTADEIVAACGGRVPDVLNGSPPCEVFSTNGKREEAWNVERDYYGRKQRVDDLFFEFSRLVDTLRPRAFTAENVSGMVKGTSRGYFNLVLEELRRIGYDVSAQLLDASFLGLPQARQRVIFVGTRSDLGLKYEFPKPYRTPPVSVREAIAGLPEIVEAAPRYEPCYGGRANNPRSRLEADGVVFGKFFARGATDAEDYATTALDNTPAEPFWKECKIGKSHPVRFNMQRVDPDRPCPTITSQGGSGPGMASVSHWSQARRFSIPEVRRISGFPDDFAIEGLCKERYARYGACVPPHLMAPVAAQLAAIL